ncbi:signal-regulatory protein beta-2-like [Amia ocellicauda]|uniref:signal-regulatory protein beta-2-like n=1 Tax=Amia ocellicauda TaxID=2972642 RepID=UPI0034646FB5
MKSLSWSLFSLLQDAEVTYTTVELAFDTVDHSILLFTSTSEIFTPDAETLHSTVAAADVVSQPQSSVTVPIGRSVTLLCSIRHTRTMTLAWLKQDVGQMPRSIATLSKYSQEMELQDEFKDGRFTVQNTSKSFDLQISHIRSSDVAVYYCAAFMYRGVACGNGTLLLLKGKTIEQCCNVEQQPASVPVQPGDSVTLQCTIHTETCAGEHSVHWFRHGSGEALPGLIYTHGNRSDPCESSSEPGLPAQGCVYELPKRNLRSSDAGTYYCAVATCGQILFGNGTRLEFAGCGLGTGLPGVQDAEVTYTTVELGLMVSWLLQPALSVTASLGDSVSLQCSTAGGSSRTFVWLRQEEIHSPLLMQ